MSGKDKAVSHELEEGQEGSLDHNQKPPVPSYIYPTASWAQGAGPSDEKRYTLPRHTMKESSGGRIRASEVLAKTGMYVPPSTLPSVSLRLVLRNEGCCFILNEIRLEGAPQP